MPFGILVMIVAFLLGLLFNYLGGAQKICLLFGKFNCSSKKLGTIRSRFYQLTIIYLLFKIGFVGGTEVIGEKWQVIIIPGLVAVMASAFWTLFILFLLKRWRFFEPITQISLATHYGSVSLGTFIAAMAFLEAVHIDVLPSVAIWLALMELPSVIIGMWKLGIKMNTIIPILKEEWSLCILPISILLGIFFGKTLPEGVKGILFGILFMPMLLYFLFEMGCKASSSVSKLKGKIGAVLLMGIAFPILGGFFGISIGYFLNYTTGSMFILGILMASASYVLAPLCIQEVLRSIYKPKPEIAKEVVAISMALSVGVTLPFNILLGFELYYLIIKGIEIWPIIAGIGLGLPLLLIIITFFRRV